MRKPLSYHCAACGKELVRPKRSGRTPRYCLENTACRAKAYRRRAKFTRLAKAEQNKLGHLSQESYEWYTPPKFIRAVKRVLGTIALDPASSEQANRTVQAQTYYDLASDGLTRSWKAQTVFMNPPYCKLGNTSNQEVWTAKLLAEYKAGHIGEAIILVTGAIETTWFHRLLSYPMCIVKGRINFTTAAGDKGGGATKGSVFFYLGKHPDRFYNVFRRFGVIVSARG